MLLLANHGVLAVAKDLTTAYARAEAVEKMAKTLWMTRLLGSETPLPPEELAQIRIDGQAARHTEMGK